MFGSRLFHRHVDDDEEILLIVHKHWLLGIRHLLWPAVCILAGLCVAYIAPFRAIYLASMLWEIGCLVWLLRNYYDYYLDAWIITTTGVIDVEWHGWFHRESARVLYSDIQGVSYEIQGVLGTMMRFGTVSIEKVSTGSVLSLDSVKNPRAVEAVILKNMEGYLHTRNLSDAKHVQEVLSSLVAREIQLEQFGDDQEYEEDDDDDDEYYDDDEDDDEYDDDDDEYYDDNDD